MRIGVVSDSHRDIMLLRQAVLQMGQIDLLLHAGDLYSDLEDISRILSVKCLGVVGNCDYDRYQPAEQIVEAEGKKIFLTHGHYFGVKYDYLKLQFHALENGYDAVVFGHTHEPLLLRREGVLLFNPGSIARPRTGGFSYGILTVEKSGIQAQLLELL